MGQKCCSPTMRVNPKHTHLLTLIYTEAQENVHNIDYNEIKEYLAKRGHVKMLGDYLSSHLNQIAPSIAYCNNIHMSARGRDPKALLFLCCITSEILHRVSKVSQEGKLIHTMKTNNTKKSSTSSDYQAKGTVAHKSKHDSKREKVRESVQKLKNAGKKPLKENVLTEYHQEQVNYNLLEISNELLKQTIISRQILERDKPVDSSDPKIEMTAYNILISVQSLLKNALSQSQNMVKVNHLMIKELLDSFIFILMMSKKESIEQEKTQFRIKRFGSIASPVKNPIKNQRQSRDFQIGLTGKPQSQVQISMLKNLKVSEKQIDIIRQLTVQDYYLLLKQANLHLAGGSINMDIIKNHMPRFLEYWTDLMIESDDHLYEKARSLPVKPEDSESQNNQSPNNIQFLIQAIMHQLFNNFFSVRHSDFIYQEFVTAYDRIAFNKSKVRLIQKFLFKVLRNYQLRSSFISRLFDSLLSYLGIIASSPHQINQNTLNDSRDYGKRIQFLNFNTPEIAHYLNDIGQSLNFLNDRAEYVNWHKQENIIGCMETVHRWMQSDEVDLEDIITYKRTRLFVAMLVNLSWGSRAIGEQIYKFFRFLIQKDIRCFGYLMDTSIYVIKRIKLPTTQHHEQKSWDTFLQSWKKYNSGLFKIKSAQNQFYRIGQQSSSKIKTPSALKRLNTLQSNVETIPVQRFIDQVISVASFPFLGDILANEGFDLPHLGDDSLRKVQSGSQIIMETRVSEIGTHKDNELQSSRKNQQSRVTSIREIGKQDLKKSISARDYIRQSKAVQQNLKDFSKFAHIHSHIFQQVIEILLKGIQITRPKMYFKYQVKLASLVMTSNLVVMSQVIEKINRKGVSEWLFSMVSRINRFLSNIYKQMEIFNSSVDAQVVQIYIGPDNQSYQNSQSISKNLSNDKDKESNLEQYIKEELKKEIIKFGIIRPILNSIEKWFYPALTQSLIFPTCIEERQAQSGMELMSPSSENNLRILLGICVKIYFQHLVNISIENFQQGIRSQHNIEPLHNEQFLSPNNLYPQPRYEKPAYKGSGAKTNVKGFDNAHLNKDEKQIINEIVGKDKRAKAYFLPIFQIYEIFLVFYKKYTNRVQQSGIKTAKSTILETSNSFNSGDKFNKGDDLQNLVIRIKASLDKLKRNEIILIKQSNQKLQTRSSVVKHRKSSTGSNFLDNIPLADQHQFNIEQKINAFETHTNYNQQTLMAECNEIVQNINLSKYMSIFVETISEVKNDNSDTFTKETEKKVCVSKVTETYLKKDQIIPIKFEDKQQSEECFCFKKSNNKVLNVPTSKQTDFIKEQQFARQAGNDPLSETPKLKKGETILNTELTAQNCAVLTPKIIERYSSYYKFQIPTTLDTHKGRSSFKTKVFSNLTDHNYAAEKSVVDTSSMKTESVEPNSFHEIYQQVQKH